MALCEHPDEFQRLITSAARGGRAELAELWREYNPRLLGWLKAVEPVAAEDLASDVWIEAMRSVKQFVGTENNFRSWLFTIARRRVIDFRRRAMRRPDQCVNMVPDAPSRNIEDLVAERDGAEGALSLIIGVLTPEQAEVVVLRIVGGLSAAEVAATLDTTPEAVRVTQHRALRKLERVLQPADLELQLEA